MKRLLCWDTTTEFASVAICEEGETIAELNYRSGLKHSSVLLPMIEFLLESTGLKLDDFTAFSAAIGPGSFTGIRVGLAVAKAFCFATGKPFLPVVSLDALALKEKGKVAAMIDAKKQEVFASLYQDGKRLKEPVNIKPREFLEELKGEEVVFIGTGAIRYRELIRETLGEKALFSSRSLFAAAEIGALAFKAYERGESLKPDEIKPLYIRASDAELKRWQK